MKRYEKIEESLSENARQTRRFDALHQLRVVNQLTDDVSQAEVSVGAQKTVKRQGLGMKSDTKTIINI